MLFFHSKSTFLFTFLHITIILQTNPTFGDTMNWSKLDVKTAENLTKFLFINFLSKLQLKIDRDEFNEEDMRSFEYLLNEIQKRNKKSNRSNNIVYWYSRQGRSWSINY